MKKVIVTLSVFALAFAWMYVAGTYVAMDYDVRNWDQSSRMLHWFMASLCSGVALAVQLGIKL